MQLPLLLLTTLAPLVAPVSRAGLTQRHGETQPAVQQPKVQPAVAGPSALLTVEEALELCFPDCTIRRGTVFLEEEEVERVEDLSGVKGIRAIAHPYEAFDKEGELVGTAWFDSRKVRSKKQTLMVAADPKGRILRVEVLAFAEPRQYLPPAKWFGQILGKELGPELSLDGEVRNLAGATLSARATVASARLALALQSVLAARPEPEGPEGTASRAEGPER
jgi:hypothetical protein